MSREPVEAEPAPGATGRLLARTAAAGLALFLGACADGGPEGTPPLLAPGVGPAPERPSEPRPAEPELAVDPLLDPPAATAASDVADGPPGDGPVPAPVDPLLEELLRSPVHAADAADLVDELDLDSRLTDRLADLIEDWRVERARAAAESDPSRAAELARAADARRVREVERLFEPAVAERVLAWLEGRAPRR